MAGFWNRFLVASVIGMGSMAPFCTRLPIQSCAPITRSGPVPACEAVTNCACRSLEIVCTSTVTPLSVANAALAALMAGPYRSSAQMVSVPSVDPPAAAEPAADVAAALPLPAALPAALVELVVVLDPPPQAATASATTPARAASRVFLSCMVLTPQRCHRDGRPGPQSTTAPGAGARSGWDC